MKLNGLFKKVQSKVLLGCLSALSTTVAYSGTMGEPINPPGTIYFSIFGGGSSVGSTHIRQFGTAFFSEAAGGPLAVNSFGEARSDSTGVIGGHVGFAWPRNLGIYLPVTPAIELEGYYMGGVKIKGHDLSNDTVRLPEHDFFVKYPLKTGVFLVNGVLNATNSIFNWFRPYVGVGMGGAVISVSDANSIQLSPPEPGVNHYGADTHDRTFTFAAQPKIGVHIDFNPYLNIFAEYRYLYLSRTNFTFGSTIAPGHAPTSPWLVSIKNQRYNMGTVGVEFDV